MIALKNQEKPKCCPVCKSELLVSYSENSDDIGEWDYWQCHSCESKFVIFL